MFTEIASKYVQVLKDLTVSIRVELVQFPREYLIKKETHPGKSPRFGGFIESEQLKKVDELLLKEIANNARLSVLELAKRVQKPASTVGGRLKQLETKGIIQGYSAQIRCQEFGYQSYQLFIKAHNLTKQNKRRLLAYCQAHANIIFYIETVGEWNFELIYEIESQKQLQDLIIELRTKFSDLIKDVESIVRFRAEHYKDFCHTMPQVERERAYIKRLLLASVHAIKRLQKTLDLLLREGEENLAHFFPSGAEGVVDVVSCRNPLYKSVRVQKPQLGRKRLGSNLELLFERAEIYLPAEIEDREQRDHPLFPKQLRHPQQEVVSGPHGIPADTQAYKFFLA